MSRSRIAPLPLGSGMKGRQARSSPADCRCTTGFIAGGAGPARLGGQGELLRFTLPRASLGLDPEDLGGAGDLGTMFPRFDGSVFTGDTAGRLAYCEGDELLDWGGIPSGYERYDRESVSWGDATGYKVGYAYLLVARSDGFRMIVLQDTVAPRRRASTYCDYLVVAEVTGTITRQKYKCSRDETDIYVYLDWSISVRRALASSLALVEVFDGTIKSVLVLPNADITDRTRWRLIHWMHPGTGAGSIDLGHASFSDSDTSGCSGVGGQYLQDMEAGLAYLSSSAEARSADSSGSYVGGGDCDVAHLLYLVGKSEAFQEAADWLISVCRTAPIACGPEEVDDGTITTETGTVVGP